MHELRVSEKIKKKLQEIETKILSGETLLRHVADKLVEMSRSSDVISRVAEGKFMIILPETNAENASKVIQLPVAKINRD